MNSHKIGLDIGGSHVSAGVVDTATGSLLEESYTFAKVNCHESATDIIARWAYAIKETIRKSGQVVTDLGIAIPGPFNYERGICTMSGVGKYDNLYGLDVMQSLLAHLTGAGVERIRFTNDATAFALGEYFTRFAGKSGRMVALTLGTGVGSGFVADGKLVVSGESVPANGWVYCLPFDGGIADEKLSTRWFQSRSKELTGWSVEGVRQLADTVETDPAARFIFTEYGIRLADFVLPVFRKFEGDHLVLGGNISRASTHFIPSMKTRLENHGAFMDISISTLNEKTALVGAASLFINLE